MRTREVENPPEKEKWKHRIKYHSRSHKYRSHKYRAKYGAQGHIAETFMAEAGEANARLIAAAPDLLEALESIAENLENKVMTSDQENAFRHSPVCDTWRVYLSSLILQARNEARTAIAKVKGEA